MCRRKGPEKNNEKNLSKCMEATESCFKTRAWIWEFWVSTTIFK